METARQILSSCILQCPSGEIRTGTRMRRRLVVVRRVAFVAGATLLGLVRDLFVAAPGDAESDDRRLHDADSTGQYNYRTGRLDAGTDPYGWYDYE